MWLYRNFAEIPDFDYVVSLSVIGNTCYPFIIYLNVTFSRCLVWIAFASWLGSFLSLSLSLSLSVFKYSNSVSVKFISDHLRQVSSKHRKLNEVHIES